MTNNYCTMSSLSTKFHTFVLEWSPSQMKIIYDGQTCLQNDNWQSTLGGRAPG